LKVSFLVLALAFSIFIAVGCSAASIEPGSALLPEGIEEAVVPDAKFSGYVFSSANPPLRLAVDYLRPRQGFDVLPAEAPAWVEVVRATTVIGSTPDSFGALLDFSSEEQAAAAWAAIQSKVSNGSVWGKRASPWLMVVSGEPTWADSVQHVMDSGWFIPLKERDPKAWNLLTNLPKNPPQRPLAAGVLNLDNNLLKLLAVKGNIALEGEIEKAIGLIKVDNFAFGVYTDEPIAVSGAIDQEFIKSSNASILFVTHSGYRGALVSFLLSVAAGRMQMETIPLGETNARYRMVGELHLVVKNKGSILFAALAATREDAEGLMLSAIAG
jgi:hypothetical protein